MSDNTSQSAPVTDEELDILEGTHAALYDSGEAARLPSIAGALNIACRSVAELRALRADALRSMVARAETAEAELDAARAEIERLKGERDAGRDLGEKLRNLVDYPNTEGASVAVEQALVAYEATISASDGAHKS